MDIERLWRRKLEIMLGLLALLGAANTVLTFYDLAPYGYDLDYSEGFVIEDVKRLAGPGTLYPDPSLENGFESVKYPPLFYLVFAALGELLGYGFLTGRLISVAATASATGLIYLIARRRSDERPWLAPLMFLVPYLTIFTGVTIRTDMLALTFSLAGLYFAAGEDYWHALPFFVLAALTKQVFVAGFIATALYLALEGNVFRELLRAASSEELLKVLQENRVFFGFTGLYAAAGLTSIVALQLVYPDFLFNILGANLGGFNIRLDLLTWLHLTFIPVAALSAYYVFLFRDRLLGSYLAISTAVMLLQMMRGGAWVYSAIQPFAAAVICCGILYRRTKETAIYLPVSCLLLLQLLVFMQAPFVSGNVFDIRTMDDRNTEADALIASHIRGEDVYTEYAGYTLFEGRDAPVEIWGFYEQYASGRINASDVRKFFRQKNYTVIAAYKRLYRLPVEEYLDENYRVMNETMRYDMLLNRERWRVYRWNG